MNADPDKSQGRPEVGIVLPEGEREDRPSDEWAQARVPARTNADLVGRPGSRQMLDTPCLLVDLPTLENNIRLGAEMVHGAGKTFRPHAKSHKCVEIAERQINAGACGLSVASIGEAEVLSAGGISDILITSTFATDRQIGRLLKLLFHGVKLSLVVDHPQVVSRLNDALIQSNLIADVLIDCDMGRQRSGCSDESSAGSLARQIESARSLRLTGIQAYAGHLSHMESHADRQAAAKEAAQRTQAFQQAVSGGAGLPLPHCTGGSTGASPFDLADPFLTELQWGSYVFMDVEYSRVEFTRSGNISPFSQCLFVASRVISANAKGRYTMDAGDKRFANKYGAIPLVAEGAPGKTRFRPVSDEHGLLEAEDADLLPGDVVELLVPHCDPTVNLFDDIHVVDGDKLVDIWSVAARGVY